jgi:hypothetical protein
MLAEFVRNRNQFENLSKSVKTFRTVDLYTEFANLGNYFNNTLKTEFENILNITLATVPDKFLINVSNGTINWVDITNVIEDNSIPLNKIQKIPNKSVLCSDGYGDIIPIQCTIDYGILFARYQNTHIWRKLLNEDILDQSITGTQIDTLGPINLDDELTDNFITDNLLGTVHIADSTISSDKIIDGTLDKNLIKLPNGKVKTGFIPDKYVNDVGVNNLLAFAAGFLTPDNIMDGTIYPTDNPRLFSLREYSDHQFYLHKNLDVGYEYPENFNLNVAELLESFNILPECLGDEHLIPYDDIGDWNNIPWHDNYKEPRYFTQGYIAPRDDCRVEGRCIPNRCLRLRHFDDEVRAALLAKGVTNDD